MKLRQFLLSLALIACGFSFQAKADDFLFNLSAFDQGLDVISHQVYTYKAKALREWAKQYRTLPIPDNIDSHQNSSGLNSRLFLIYSIAPIIRDIQTPSFIKDGLPLYEEEYRLLTNQFGFHTISELNADPITLNLALQGIHISLAACEGHISNENDLTVYNRLFKDIGMAVSGLKGTGSVIQARAMLATLDKPEANALLNNLLTLERTQGFAMSILEYMKWLKIKIIGN